MPTLQYYGRMLIKYIGIIQRMRDLAIRHFHSAESILIHNFSKFLGHFKYLKSIPHSSLSTLNNKQTRTKNNNYFYTSVNKKVNY